MAPLVPPSHHHAVHNTTNSNTSNSQAGAQSLQIVTLSIPNPEWPSSDPVVHRIDGTISYMDILSFDLRTLSSNGATGGNDITGLLYVPDLASTDPCKNASAPYVPQNVTRRANLPDVDDSLVAIAPWVSGNCSLSYMAAARDDPARAMLFFIPGDSTDTPPDSSDAVWRTDDNKWKAKNGFPVYAIPSQSGGEFMYQSSLYSKNMTDVPYGHDLTEIYPTTDYVRLFVDIDVGSTSDLPSLWIFLLVVLGILLAIIGLTSGVMHWLQRRRRDALRRRVASGEVDLEALGIKRLTVPQDILDGMPLYIYGTAPPVASSDGPIEEKDETAGESSAPAPALLRSRSYRPTPLSQPTCAICLDDFVPASSETEGTTVRELPCHHIFHPECVDTFLRDSSSLCPMCKKTTLPRGYCPRTVTNAMVRRERMVRQLRERISSDPEAAEPSSLNDRDLARSLQRFRSGFSNSLGPRRVVSNGQQMQQMESTAPSTATPLVSADPPTESPVVQPPATPGRREWARRRAEAMLGQRAPADPEAEDAQNTPGWRKAVRGLFPRR